MLLVNRQQLLTKALDIGELSTRVPKGFRPAGRCRGPARVRGEGIGTRCGRSHSAWSPSCNVARSPSAPRRVRTARSTLPTVGAAGSRLPQADDRSRCRRGCGPHLSDGGSMRPSASRNRAMLERISASPRNATVLVRLTMTAASVVAVTRWSTQPCIRQRTLCCIMADGHRSDPGPCGIAKRGSVKGAKVALARRLAVVMHRMWTDGTDFRWSDTSRMTVPTAA